MKNMKKLFTPLMLTLSWLWRRAKPPQLRPNR